MEKEHTVFDGGSLPTLSQPRFSNHSRYPMIDSKQKGAAAWLPLCYRIAFRGLEGNFRPQDYAAPAQTTQRRVGVTSRAVGVCSTARVEEVVGKRSAIGEVSVVDYGIRNAQELVIEQIVDLCLEPQ